MKKKILFIALLLGLAFIIYIGFIGSFVHKYDKTETMEKQFCKTNGLDNLTLTQTTIKEVYPSFKGKRTVQDMLLYDDAVYLPQKYGEYHQTLKWKRIMVPKMYFWGITADVYCDFYKNKLVHLWAFLRENDLSLLKKKFGNGISFEDYGNDIYVPYDIIHFFDCDRVDNTLHLYINDDIWMICNYDSQKPKLEVFAKTPYFELLSNMGDAYTNKSTEDRYHTPKGYGSQNANDEEYWNSVNREKTLRNSGNDAAADLEKRERLKYLQGGGYHSKDGGHQVHFQGSKEQEEQLRQMDEMGW